MKKFLLATTALIALAGPVAAADLPARVYTKAPPLAAVLAYNWTGFYVGGHIGVGWRDSGNSNARFLGGFQGGADYQFYQNWVAGVEANYSFLTGNSGGNGRAFGVGGLVTTNGNTGLGSVTGRLGYAWGPALVYFKGGYAFRDNTNTSVTVLGAPVAFAVNRQSDGYTLGGGVEYMFAPHWSGKLEYQYFDFGSTTYTAGPAALVALSPTNSQTHTFKAGINYRF